MGNASRYVPLTGALSLALLVGCGGDSPVESETSVLSISPLSLPVAAEEGEEEVLISNSGDGDLEWTITEPEEAWITLSPLSGGDQETVTLQYDWNTGADPRTATIPSPRTAVTWI